MRTAPVVQHGAGPRWVLRLVHGHPMTFALGFVGALLGWACWAVHA